MNCLLKTTFLILYLIGLGETLFAQNIHYENFDISEGLPSSETYDVYIDSAGFVWFSSDRGLIRYNSYEFEVFSLKDGLSHMVNFSFYRGAANTFWINAMDGTFSFWNGHNFFPFAHNDRLQELQKAGNQFYDIAYVDKQHIDFLSIVNLNNYRIDRKTGEILPIDIWDLRCSENSSIKVKRNVRWRQFIDTTTIHSYHLQPHELILFAKDRIPNFNVDTPIP